MVTDAIITDIRENWQNEDLYKAKVTNWNYINCFMFAVFSVHRGSAPFSIYTVPAEKSFLRDVTF